MGGTFVNSLLQVGSVGGTGMAPAASSYPCELKALGFLEMNRLAKRSSPIVRVKAASRPRANTPGWGKLRTSERREIIFGGRNIPPVHI